jgi:hypothetical protein
MGDDVTKPQSKPFLLVITGPILRYLSDKKIVHDEEGNLIPAKPMAYWPFGVAGASLFGLGLMGGYAFMSGDVKEESIERERFKGMNVQERDLALNRKHAFRTALARLDPCFVD